VASGRGLKKRGSALVLWVKVARKGLYFYDMKCLADMHLAMSNSSYIQWDRRHLAQAVHKVLGNTLGVDSSVPAPGLQSSIIGNSSVSTTTSIYCLYSGGLCNDAERRFRVYLFGNYIYLDETCMAEGWDGEK